MNRVGERLGASLRRAPYVWLALTILLYVMIESPVAAMVTRPSDASTPVAAAAVALIVLAVVWSEVFVPRLMVPRLRSTMSDDEIALICWGYGALPIVIGISAVALRGQSWAFVVGLVASTALTIRMARAISRTRHAEA